MGRSLPERVNLCPFFWRMILSPVVNLIWLPFGALLLLFWTILIWTPALLFGHYVSYWDHHWDKKAQSFVKNHWLWDCMRFNLYENTYTSYRDSRMPWKYKKISWIPKFLGFQSMPIVVGGIFVLAYTQLYGWMSVYHGYVWRWDTTTFFGSETNLIDVSAIVVWLFTTVIAMIVGIFFLIGFSYNSKVGETVREFAKAKKQGLCPEIEVVP
jgi:hypothetical protein